VPRRGEICPEGALGLPRHPSWLLQGLRFSPCGSGLGAGGGGVRGWNHSQVCPHPRRCWDAAGGTLPHPDASPVPREAQTPACAAQLSSCSPRTCQDPPAVARGDGKPWPQPSARPHRQPSRWLSPSPGQSITPGLPCTKPWGHSPWAGVPPRLSEGDGPHGPWGRLEEEPPFPPPTAASTNRHLQNPVPHVARRRGGSLGTRQPGVTPLGSRRRRDGHRAAPRTPIPRRDGRSPGAGGSRPSPAGQRQGANLCSD